MRTRLPIAVAIASLLLIPAAPAVAAPADDGNAPVLTSIALSPTSVTVSGMQTVLVTVTVHLTDQTGVYAGTSGGDAGLILGTPGVYFAGVGEWAFLELASGTPQDGVWTGPVAVTSKWSGTVRPSLVAAEDENGHRLSVDPGTVVSTPAISVRSSHRPAVRISFSPDPATPGQQVTEYVRVTDSATGQPVSHAPLRLAFDNGCAESTGTPATAGFFGTYQAVLPAAQATSNLGHCAWVEGADPPRPTPWPVIIASAFVSIRFRYAVTATPARTSAPAGTNVTVTGSIKPPANKSIQLQRLSGSTWTTVNTARAGSENGAYTVVATPPGRATYSYRVNAPTDASNVGGTSKTFTIRGT
jgi:hypothetical protein